MVEICSIVEKIYTFVVIISTIVEKICSMF